MSMAWPSGARASSRALAPPLSFSVGAPEARLTTPMSFIWTPRLNPVPTALEKASLAAKRLARVPARVCGRDAALARSVSVNTRLRNLSLQRASDFSIRSMLHRSEPMPTIMKPSPLEGEGAERSEAGEGASGQGCTLPHPPTASRRAPPSPSRGEGLSPRFVHQRAHAAYAGLEAGEDRLADQEMPDVELGELGDRGHRNHIIEGQAVAGVRLDAVLDRERRAIGDALQLRRALLAVEMGIAAGVEFDDRRAEAHGRRHLLLGRFDEQADADVRGA